MTCFKMDEEYRQSEEYITWVNAIKKDYPSLPLYLIESAIIQHKLDPQFYKKAKDAKEVFKKGCVPKKNHQEIIVEDAIKVEKPIEPEPSTIITEIAEDV